MLDRSTKSSWRYLGEFMRPYNFHTYEEAYEKLQRGTLHAIIADKSYLQSRWKQNEYCDIEIVDDVYNFGAAFALRKGSMWNDIISTLIRKYKSNGILGHITRLYRALHCQQQTKAQPDQFGVLYLSGACMLLVMGTIFSGLFFVLEHVLIACVKKFGRHSHDSYTIQ